MAPPCFSLISQRDDHAPRSTTNERPDHHCDHFVRIVEFSLRVETNLDLDERETAGCNGYRRLGSGDGLAFESQVSRQARENIVQCEP